MKRFNKVIYIVLFFFSAFFCTTGVMARSGNDLCSYDNGDERSAHIYYTGKEIRIEYRQSDFGGDSGDKSINNEYVYMSSYAKESLLSKGECPEDIYIDINGNNELCLDNGGGYCRDTKNFAKDERAGLKHDWFEWKVKILKTEASVRTDFSDKSCTDYLQDKTALQSLVLEQIEEQMSYLIDDYPSQYKDKVIKAMEEVYARELKEGPYVEFQNRCEAELREKEQNGSMSSEEVEEKIEILKDFDIEEIKSEIGRIVINSYGNSYTGRIYCGIFGQDTFGFIKSAYSVIKILIPVLIIVLGIIDFLKVVFSGEEKDMKASGTRFLKRIIIGVIFILLPVLIEFLMNLFGFSKDCLLELMK